MGRRFQSGPARGDLETPEPRQHGLLLDLVRGGHHDGNECHRFRSLKRDRQPDGERSLHVPHGSAAHDGRWIDPLLQLQALCDDDRPRVLGHGFAFREFRHLNMASTYFYGPQGVAWTRGHPRLRRSQGKVPLPDFWLPFDDAGSGICTITEVNGRAAATFTRATTAWTRLASGLWGSIASGSPRSYYTAAGTYGGVLIELGRTNRCLWSRDLTNAAWTKTSTTAAKDAVGIDGVAYSCSTLTATGANGTCLQAIVNASVARVFSAWVKRKTGTGTVNITIDNGTTWTAITINSTTWTLVQRTQTLADPTVGFRIVTSGDEIIVDMCQEETGAEASTPIPTTTASVARNADVLSYPTSAWLNAVNGTFAAIFSLLQTPTSGGHAVYTASDGTTAERLLHYLNAINSFRQF